MLTEADRKEKYKGVERLRLNRVENLRRLKDLYGSWIALSNACRYDPSFLTAIAGPNPRRTIGEKLARSLEENMGLSPGALDKETK